MCKEFVGTVTDRPEPLPDFPDDEPEFSLSVSLSHLLRRSHFHAESLFAQMFDDIGITSRQLSLLVAVAENPGASQRQLSQAVTLDVNTVSDTLRRMERKSLIFRNASANDGRSVTVTLTEQGREILETAVSRNAMFQEMISEQLQPDETDQLKTLINKMLQ